MNVVDPRIEAYLESLPAPSAGVAREMEETAARRHFPIVGPVVGGLLHLLARAVKAHHVLECGSGFGYSAYWFATAIPDGGRVVLTEGSPENCRMAADFLGRAGLMERVTIHQANAFDVLERVAGPFDIVFCDIDKRDYPRLYPFLKTRLRPGGLFICDNMLWMGKVIGPDSDEDTRGVRELTRLLHADPAYLTTLLPVRDGVSISYRLS